jgi:hypothetical protein
MNLLMWGWPSRKKLAVEVLVDIPQEELLEKKELIDRLSEEHPMLRTLEFLASGVMFYVSENTMPSSSLNEDECFRFEQWGYHKIDRDFSYSSNPASTRRRLFCCTREGFWWEALFGIGDIELVSKVVPWSFINDRTP